MEEGSCEKYKHVGQLIMNKIVFNLPSCREERGRQEDYSMNLAGQGMG